MYTIYIIFTDILLALWFSFLDYLKMPKNELGHYVIAVTICLFFCYD